ncbi:MAG: site-specific integrase [Holophagaceae bacterium]|nr:site-specific integrase [Holophagaceae bacterium]
MKNPKPPKLCCQKKKSGNLAYVSLNGTKHYLGRYGTLESKEQYLRLISEWTAIEKSPAKSKVKDVTITVNELVAAFLDHAENYYVKNGRVTESYGHFVRISDRLKKIYGSIHVDEFTPDCLETMQKVLISDRKVQNPKLAQNKQVLSRKYVNQCIGRIRHIFKWGVSRKKVKPDTHYYLMQLPDLKKGRSKAKELPKVKPVDDAVVEKTLPYLPSPVQVMVKLQRLTGMRPGEVRVMRLCDIDTTQEEWFYIPWEHKTEHHDDCPRLVVLGGKSQSILMPYLMDNYDTPEKWLFSPIESMRERNMKARERRKTKVQPSQIDRKKARPKQTLRDQYTKDSYRRCISRAAEKAGVPHWFPNQLRHTALTAIRAKEGIEAAQVMASHKNISTTEIYAEKDIAKARELARKYG